MPFYAENLQFGSVDKQACHAKNFKISTGTRQRARQKVREKGQEARNKRQEVRGKSQKLHCPLYIYGLVVKLLSVERQGPQEKRHKKMANMPKTVVTCFK